MPNQFIGFTLVCVIGAVGMALLRNAGISPEFVSALTALNPWAGEHAVGLSWVAIAAVFLATALIPYVLMQRDVMGDGVGLEAVGEFTSEVSAIAVVCYAVFFVAIPALGYLLGIGWFAAKAALNGPI